MSTSYPPTPPPVSGEPTIPSLTPAGHRPSWRGLIIGIVVLVVGLAGGIILIVTSTMSTLSSLANGSVTAPATATVVTLDGGTTYGIWTSPDTLGAGSCQVTDPAGQDVPLGGPTITEQVVDYYLSFTFAAPSTGPYTVECPKITDINGKFMVSGPFTVGHMAAGIIGGVIIIIVTFFVGLALIIITGIRRASWKRRQAASANQLR